MKFTPDMFTTYEIYMDSLGHFYAAPIGDFDGGPHSHTYKTVEELSKVIASQEDTLLFDGI